MRFRNARGFSLLEMTIVIAICLIMAAITTVSYMPLAKQQHVTDAYNSTLTTLRRARDQAAADMRIYVVTFTPPSAITVAQSGAITCQVPPTGPVMMTTVLPTDITIHVEPGVPTSPTVAPTTPDGFGTAANAVDFDQGVGAAGGTTVCFFPDGTAQDVLGNLNSGVVYFGRPGDLWSSRAITVWGATGRIRGWRLLNQSGAATWRQQ
jgi:prepilin-type N-terminal cleavage/methylation domain-containing protein